jgi:predicted PurR-regulated permease PerM
MRKFRIRRPSAAMIVAIAALSLALVGTAVAAGVFTKQEKKVIKKISRKQAQKLIGQLAIPTKGNVTVQKVDFQVADNTANGAIAKCPPGQQVISGGVITGANDSYITNSVPADAVIGELSNGQTFTAWRGFVVNQLGQSGTVTSTVYAVCSG